MARVREADLLAAVAAGPADVAARMVYADWLGRAREITRPWHAGSHVGWRRGRGRDHAASIVEQATLAADALELDDLDTLRPIDG